MEADKLVEKGVQLFEKGDYNGAMDKYDQALILDPRNQWATVEKAAALAALDSLELSLEWCEKAISLDPNSDLLASVYLTYGTALDQLDREEEALEVFGKGIAQFPDFYPLYFEKGLTLLRVEESDSGITLINMAAQLQPDFAAAHEAIGYIQFDNMDRIPALLAFCRFLTLEPNGESAQKILSLVRLTLLTKSTDITQEELGALLHPDMFSVVDTEHIPPNDFRYAALLYAMSGEIDMIKHAKKMEEVDVFRWRFERLINTLGLIASGGKGYYWEYYVPYFLEMKQRHLVEPFSYLVFASSDDKKVGKWIEKNETLLQDFFKWNEAYDWKKER